MAAVVVAGQSGLRSRIGRCNNRSLAHDRSEPVLNRKPSVPLSAPSAPPLSQSLSQSLSLSLSLSLSQNQNQSQNQSQNLNQSQNQREYAPPPLRPCAADLAILSSHSLAWLTRHRPNPCVPPPPVPPSLSRAGMANLSSH